MAISISWLWLKTRGRDQTSISPRPTSLADPLAACRFASKPESSSPALAPELAQSDQDFNTSRSLISWYGSPLYHVGIGSSAPITERFTIGAQLLSGCNTTGGAHGHQSMAYTAGWAGKPWSWSQLYMGETRSW